MNISGRVCGKGEVVVEYSYKVARQGRLFGRDGASHACGLAFKVTPAHFIFRSCGIIYIQVTNFILVWIVFTQI